MSIRIRLWADFNEADNDRVWTSLRRTNFLPKGGPRLGDVVELWDGDDNRCLAVVEDIHDPVVFLRMDLRTWTERPHLEGLRDYEGRTPQLLDPVSEPNVPTVGYAAQTH